MENVAGVTDAVGRGAARTRVRASSRARLFYLAVSAILTVYVLVGFWASYFGPVLAGTFARPWFFQVHGAIMAGWLVLLLAQVMLAVRRRVDLHRRLGTFGIGYGVLLFLTGMGMSFVAPIMHVRAGEWSVDQSAGFMLVPLVDMALFAGFFGAAVYYKRRPEVHKRLIMVTTIALAFAAVYRMALPTVPYFFLWMSPLFAAMLFDYVTRRRVHPVYLIAFPVLALSFTRLFLTESEAWLTIGRALLVPLI